MRSIHIESILKSCAKYSAILLISLHKNDGMFGKSDQSAVVWKLDAKVSMLVIN